jgi:hypothetical protein
MTALPCGAQSDPTRGLYVPVSPSDPDQPELDINPSAPRPRIAPVIGEQFYSAAKSGLDRLENPLADSDLITRTLGELGFALPVRDGANLRSQDDIRAAIERIKP